MGFGSVMSGERWRRERNNPRAGGLKETKGGERNYRDKLERGERKCDFGSF